jgi:hypothetical protein
VTTFAHTQSQAVKDAIAKKDLEAYKKAIVEDASKKASDITPEEFSKITQKYDENQAVKKSITDNNYEEFKKVAGERMLKNIDSQAKFDELVAFTKKRSEIEAKVLEAVKNNNFESFKSAEKEMRDLRKENFGNSQKQKSEPTEEQLKNRFDELVAYYKANGSLPEKGFGHGGGRGGKFKFFK